MQSKERSHENIRPTPKPQAAQPVSHTAELIDLSMTPEAIFQRAGSGTDSITPRDVLHLQRAVGNQAVLRILGKQDHHLASRSPIQAKLTVGPADDAYEQEADRIADQVVGMSAPQFAPPATPPAVQRQEDEEEIQTKSLAASITPLVQRQEDEEELQTKALQRQEDEEEIQTQTLQRWEDSRKSFAPSDSVQNRLAASLSSGSPLPPEARAFMEPRFGADFSGVRLHTGSEAAQLNRELSAKAFTHGQDIYVGEGRYDPGSDAGKRLLAHELTHTIQQGASPVTRHGQSQETTIRQDRLTSSVAGGLQRGAGAIQRETFTLEETDYLVLSTVPGTQMKVVRENWKPWSDKRIYDPEKNVLFAFSLSQRQANQLSEVFAQLVTEHIGKLDELAREVNHANQLGIPISLATFRLRMIKQTVHDVVLERLRQDHASLIESGMLSDQVSDNFDEALDSLEIPGSDPHKGGQVVVMVKYHTQLGETEKIVYKPGDLHVDRFLLGDNPQSVASSLGLDLKTYQIITKTDSNRGALFEHYGYLEYVHTETPENKADVIGVYRSMGKTLAMAYVFGLRDLHEGNYKMRKNEIMLLDMEAATGTFSTFDALDQRNFYRDIETKIADGFSNMSTTDLADELPDDNTLVEAVVTGFNEQQTELGWVGSPEGEEFAQQFATKRARFVPIPTNNLQGTAGLVAGKLGPRAKQSDLNTYNREVNSLIIYGLDSAKAPEEDVPQLRIDLEVMLKDRATREAFNRGDVPFWMREGNDIYSEDGRCIVRDCPHPRLASTEDILAGIQHRAGTTGQEEGQVKLTAQVLTVRGVNTPSTTIKNNHRFTRQIMAGKGKIKQTDI